MHVLGSDKAAIEKAIAQTRSNAAPLTLPVTMTVADGKVTVNVPAAKGNASDSGEVWLCPITGKAPVAIGRGENSGHTLTYNNVVRRWVKLGDWNGKAQSFSVPVSRSAQRRYSLQDIDRLTVLVQSGVAAKPGLMLGAATTTLRSNSATRTIAAQRGSRCMRRVECARMRRTIARVTRNKIAAQD